MEKTKKQNREIIKLIDKANKTQSDSVYSYNGIPVPRVTEIISTCIHSDSLLYWANSLGFKHKSYKKTIQEAADIGTECHNTIDLFLDNDYKYDASFTYTSAQYAYESFLKWWNEININNNVNVIFHEKKLVCPYFGGTLDGLYEINGKKYLIDYKTSNHITFRYCLQLAAYRYMLREFYGINIDGCIILQLSKNEIKYNEYLLTFDNIYHLQYMNNCEYTFLCMVNSFMNIKYVEHEYDKLKWGQ